MRASGKNFPGPSGGVIFEGQTSRAPDILPPRLRWCLGRVATGSAAGSSTSRKIPRGQRLRGTGGLAKAVKIPSRGCAAALNFDNAGHERDAPCRDSRAFLGPHRLAGTKVARERGNMGRVRPTSVIYAADSVVRKADQTPWASPRAPNKASPQFWGAGSATVPSVEERGFLRSPSKGGSSHAQHQAT